MDALFRMAEREDQGEWAYLVTLVAGEGAEEYLGAWRVGRQQRPPSRRRRHERERERTGAGRECSAHAGGDGIGGGKERKGCSSRRNNYYFTIFSFHYVLLCHLISVPKTCEVMPVYNL